MDIEFIVMTTAFGGRDISELQKAIPNLRICTDYRHDAMGNFLNSMRMTEKPAVHIEDDIILCNDFYNKVIKAVEQYPNDVINFFSLRKGDYEVGEPFYVSGSRFSMNQCFYIPEGEGLEIAEFYDTWERKTEHPTGYDIMMGDWLKSKKRRYLQWFPHLVNHEVCKSLIDPRRSSKRIDTQFTK